METEPTAREREYARWRAGATGHAYLITKAGHILPDVTDNRRLAADLGGIGEVVQPSWTEMAENATNPAVLLEAARAAYLVGAVDHYSILLDRVNRMSREWASDPSLSWRRVKAQDSAQRNS